MYAGADLTADEIVALGVGWCDARVSVTLAEVVSGVTLPAGFLPDCWTYNGSWSVVAGKEADVAARAAMPTIAVPFISSVSESATLTGGVILSYMDVTWPSVSTATSYEIRYALFTDADWAVWGVQDSGAVSNTFRITGLAAGQDYKFSIRAKCLWGLSDWSADFNVTAALPGDIPADVEGLSAAINRGQMLISWTPVSGVQYEIQLGTVWNSPVNTTIVKNYAGTSYPWAPTISGNIDLMIKAVNAVGNHSISAATLAYIVPPLASISGMCSYYSNNLARIQWNPITDSRQFVYEVRFGDAFATAMVLGTTTTTDFPSPSDGTYWVVAKYTDGATAYSATPASLTLGGSALTQNIVQTYDEVATGWSGTFDGGAVVDSANRVWLGLTVPTTGDFGPILMEDGSKILLEDGSVMLSEPALIVNTPGTYTIPDAHIVDIGRVARCNLSVQYTALSDLPSSLLDDVLDFDALSDLDGDYAGYSNVQIQIQVYNGGWGPWQNFIAGTYIGQKFRPRALLTSESASITAVLSAFSFTVDMPDRIDTGTLVAINSIGTAIVFTVPFHIIPNVQITILNAQPGDTITFPVVPAISGFTVQITNGGVGVARNINWMAKGY